MGERKKADSEKRAVSDLIAASFEALGRYETRQEDLRDHTERGPGPGDIYMIEAMREHGFKWAIIAHDPSDESQFLAVPADANVLVGSGDVKVSSDSASKLVLRCRHAAWTAADFLRPGMRVGLLEASDLVRARQCWLDLGDGREVCDVQAREVDEDPTYHNWIDGVIAARETLSEKQPVKELPSGLESEEEQAVPAKSVRPFWPIVLQIAAAIVMIFVGAQAWRLYEQVQGLEVGAKIAEERHEEAIHELETERDRIMAERDQLQLRVVESAALATERAEERQALLDRIADLDRVLHLAVHASTSREDEVVNPAIAFFASPKDVLRGPTKLALEPDQSHVILFFPLGSLAAASRYKLVIRKTDSGEFVWENDRLIVQDPEEIRVGVPADILPQGSYDLFILAWDGSAYQRVAVYDMLVY